MPAVVGSVANSIFAIVFILGSCIFIHELGHFVAARLAQMRVEEFMLGFPPRLVSFTRGQTRYGIGCIPFGGFCRIAGMEPGQEGVQGGFYTRPRYAQAVVIAAGAGMNVLLAVGLFTFIGVLKGVPVDYAEPPMIESLLKGDTPARRAGLRPADAIVALDGDRESLEVTDVKPGSLGGKLGLVVGDVIYRVGDADVAVPTDVLRAAGQATGEMTLKVMPPYPTGNQQTPQAKLIRGTPKQLGLPTVSFGKARLPDLWGVTFSRLTVESTRLYVMERPDRPIRMTVNRNGSEVTLSVTPQREAAAIQDEDGQIVREEIGQIGIIFAAVRRYDVAYALRSGGDDSLVIVKGIADMIYRAVRGKGRFEGVGVVGAAYYAHKQAQIGWDAVLNLCGIISVNLAFINLLPIPMVDGGRLLLIGYEAIIRRRISSHREVAWLTAGLVFIVLAFVAVTFKDVWNLIIYHAP
jgi:regulator of sigma E protease